MQGEAGHFRPASSNALTMENESVMKKNLLLFIFILVVASGSAQQVEFLSSEKLDLPEKGQGYFFPLLSPSGQLMALTSSNQQGLLVYDFDKKKLQTVSEKAGAGRKVVFSPDEEKIYFTEDSYVQNRRKSTLMVYDFQTAGKEEVTATQISQNKELSWWEQMLAWWYDETDDKEDLHIDALKDGHYSFPYVLSKGDKLIFKEDNTEKELNPFPSANYLWASLSPDNQSIVSVATGTGTFVCDTNGEHVMEIGNVEAPAWLNDDIVIGMVTEDDGHVITNSFLRAININDKSTYDHNINSSAVMHPSVAGVKQIVAAHTTDGQIVLINYRIVN